ncbi:hypothetical protein [Sphingomonas sp. SUN019]|nr:hypothetical protein [Sphingomonas sp. SUN019]
MIAFLKRLFDRRPLLLATPSDALDRTHELLEMLRDMDRIDFR